MELPPRETVLYTSYATNAALRCTVLLANIIRGDWPTSSELPSSAWTRYIGTWHRTTSLVLHANLLNGEHCFSKSFRRKPEHGLPFSKGFTWPIVPEGGEPLHAFLWANNPHLPDPADAGANESSLTETINASALEVNKSGEIIPSLVAEAFFSKAQVVIELGGCDVARGLRAQLLAQTDQLYSPGWSFLQTGKEASLLIRSLGYVIMFESAIQSTSERRRFWMEVSSFPRLHYLHCDSSNLALARCAGIHYAWIRRPHPIGVLESSCTSHISYFILTFSYLTISYSHILYLISGGEFEGGTSSPTTNLCLIML